MRINKALINNTGNTIVKILTIIDSQNRQHPHYLDISVLHTVKLT